MPIIDLVPVITPPERLIDVAPGPLSTPRWLPAIGRFIFGDAEVCVIATSAGAVQWRIAKRYRLNGWLVLENDLYLQDGCVLCQYDLQALQSGNPVPENAYNFRTRTLWSSQKPTAPFDSIFGSGDAQDIAYSAPVALRRGDAWTLYVLSGAGRLYTVPTGLAVNTAPFQSTYPPDPALALYAFGAQADGRLHYLSDGKSVALKTRPRLGAETPLPAAASSSTWNAFLRAAATPQQWSVDVAAPQTPAVIHVSRTRLADEANKPTDQLTLSWIDARTSQWRVIHVDGRANPKAIVLARLAQDGMGGPPPRLLAAPCTLPEEETTFLYALTSSAADVRLEKFKLQPEASGGNAWALLAANIAEENATMIEPWARGGGVQTPPPFDPPAASLCTVTALKAFGDDIGPLAPVLSAVQVDWFGHASRFAGQMAALHVPVEDAAWGLTEICRTLRQDREPATLRPWGPASAPGGFFWLIIASAALHAAYPDGPQPPSTAPASVSRMKAAGRSESEAFDQLRVLYGLASERWNADLTSFLPPLHCSPDSRAYCAQIGRWGQWLWRWMTVGDNWDVTANWPQSGSGDREGFLTAVKSLQQAYGLAAPALAKLFRDTKFDIVDLAEAMDISRDQCAAAACAAGFDTVRTAEALRAAKYGGGFQGVATSLVNADYPLQDVVRGVHACRLEVKDALPFFGELKSAWQARHPGEPSLALFATATIPLFSIPRGYEETLLRFLQQSFGPQNNTTFAAAWIAALLSWPYDRGLLGLSNDKWWLPDVFGTVLGKTEAQTALQLIRRIDLFAAEMRAAGFDAASAVHAIEQLFPEFPHDAVARTVQQIYSPPAGRILA